MKTLIKLILVSLFVTPAFAEEIIESSNHRDSQVVIARVVKLVQLSNDNNIMVNVVVNDLGGSTDVSPTQTVYFTMYSKGEEFSTDATFKIANVLSFNSAKEVSSGKYEISVTVYEDTIENLVYSIDARSAILDMESVKCDYFDCEASTNFSTSIKVIKN